MDCIIMNSEDTEIAKFHNLLDVQSIVFLVNPVNYVHAHDLTRSDIKNVYYVYTKTVQYYFVRYTNGTCDYMSAQDGKYINGRYITTKHLYNSFEEMCDSVRPIQKIY